MKARAIKIEDQGLVERRVLALRLARNRALYWSGNPSFTGKRFKPVRGRKNHDLEYEMALNDIENLCDQLEKLTGGKFKRSDPKANYQRKFAQLNTALVQRQNK